MTTTENSLQVTTFEQAVSLKGRKAIEFFSEVSNIDPLIQFVKKEATATVFNVNLKKDRDAIGALALKISKSRKALSEAIKISVFELETKVKAAKAVNKYMEAELNEIRDQVKAPRDEWQVGQDAIEHKRVYAIRSRIAEIDAFGVYMGNESKEEIGNLIEAIELIDVSEGFEEFAAEAALAAKGALKALNDRVLQIIEEARQREQTELLQKEQLRNQVVERLNKLAMIPMGMLGKGSEEIERTIKQVEATSVSEEEFGESYQAAVQSVGTVLSQLGLMLMQQKQLESTAPVDMPSVSGQPDLTPEIVEEVKAEADSPIMDLLGDPEERRELPKPILMHQEIIQWSDSCNLTPFAVKTLVDIIRSYGIEPTEQAR